jgi:hypothetical protein
LEENLWEEGFQGFPFLDYEPKGIESLRGLGQYMYEAG